MNVHSVARKLKANLLFTSAVRRGYGHQRCCETQCSTYASNVCSLTTTRLGVGAKEGTWPWPRVAGRV